MSMTKKEKNEIIRELESLAEKVWFLKSSHRQKRPIVIEFCGSPKAGKTTCINSLSVFLKRNGFSVKVVQERASVCPISDKLSPMFNIWTSCMSLAGMISVLEDRYDTTDFLIFDRGLFDALCWFRWLHDTGRMDRQLKKNTESFLLQKCFVQNIDIVFAFHSEPLVSIQREFANLLTTKSGTIMNSMVLGTFNKAIGLTIESHGDKFHKIFELDTSKMNQDEVGKIVTEMTLSTIRDVLMERIGYFKKTNELKQVLSTKKTFGFSELETQLISNRLHFDLRDDVEKNNQYLQPIPIAIITNKKNEILVAKKKLFENLSPEKNRLLLYFGGHTRASDVISLENETFLEICKSVLEREIKEELGITASLDDINPIIIYTPTLPKSSKHIAICFKIVIDDHIKLTLNSEEFVPHKDNNKSGCFFKAKDLLKEDLEEWSIQILKKYFEID